MWVHGTLLFGGPKKASCISGFVKNILHVCVVSTASLVWSPRFTHLLHPELTSTVTNFNIMRCRHQLTTKPSVATSSPLYPVSPPTHLCMKCRHQLSALSSVATNSPLYEVSSSTHRSIQCRHLLPFLSSVATNSALYSVSPPTHLCMKCRLQLTALFSVVTSSPLYPVSPPTHRSIQCRPSSVMYLKP